MSAKGGSGFAGKKITLSIFILILSLTLVGCQNLGDKLGAEDTQEKPEVRPNPQGGIPTAEEQKPTAADSIDSQEREYDKIFFSSKQHDPKVKNCAAVYWVHIAGDKNLDPVERSLKLLLAGPTTKWAEQGYYSVIPEGTKLNSVKVEGEIIYADFSSKLNTLAGSCAVNAARSQIHATAKATAEEYLGVEVSKVVISVDGSTEGVLQP